MNELPLKLGLVVEGDGDKQAVPELVSRLAKDLGLPFVKVVTNLRLPCGNEPERIRKIDAYTRTAGMDGLLVLQDDEDGCPKTDAPALAIGIRKLGLPFPAAVVLMFREYETLFLASLNSIAGADLEDRRGVARRGLTAGTAYPNTDLETTRGVKEWLSKRMAPGRTYKETVDQLSMTRLLDFDAIRRCGLPCFGSLERALRFLVANQGQRGAVYPEAVGNTTRSGPEQPPRTKGRRKTALP